MQFGTGKVEFAWEERDIGLRLGCGPGTEDDILKLVVRPARLASAGSSQESLQNMWRQPESSGQKYPPAVSRTLGKALPEEWLPYLLSG